MCERTGRKVPATITEGMVVGDSMGYTRLREFYKRNPLWAGVVAVITITSALAGLILDGFWGVLAGLLLGCLSLLLGPKAVSTSRRVSDATHPAPHPAAARGGCCLVS